MEAMHKENSLDFSFAVFELVNAAARAGWESITKLVLMKY